MSEQPIKPLGESPKRHVLTFYVEAMRDSVVSDVPSPNAIRVPIFKNTYVGVPGGEFAGALEHMLRLMLAPESKAQMEEVLLNLAKAQDVDDWMLRDVERTARNR
jgi:hypothetical protein